MSQPLGQRAENIAIKQTKQQAARDIITGISEWRGNRIGTAKRRWIFELIQNAIDTAKARNTTSLKIQVYSQGNSLVFRHNAGYFTLEELDAVIYGGSSKPFTPDSEYIGRFGTGFLVSHVVSAIVKVSGTIDDQGKLESFEFILDRRTDSIDELSDRISNCFQQLNQAQPQQRSVEYWTEFVYDLSNEDEKNAVDVGFQELEKNIPFLFAFNEISEIYINESVYRKTIEYCNDLCWVSIDDRTVVVKKNLETLVSVGILIDKNTIVDLKQFPKIFIAIPLVKSADFMDVPFVISSPRFKPTKERDGLDNTWKDNRVRLQQAFNLYTDLVINLSNSENSIGGYPNFVNIQLMPDEKVKENPIWGFFNECIEKTFYSIIHEVPLIQCRERLEPVSVVTFPTAEIIENADDSLYKDFCNLCAEFGKVVPGAEDALNWLPIAEKLDNLFEGEVSLYSIKLLKDELKDYVTSKSHFPTFDTFQEDLKLVDGKNFLLKYYDIVDALYMKDLCDISYTDHLLPSKAGYIGTASRRWADSNITFHLFLEDVQNPIPEDLIEIAYHIGREVQGEIVDKDFSDYSIIKNVVHRTLTPAGIIENLKETEYYKLPERITDLNEKKVDGWIKLAIWCIRHGSMMSGIPLITKSKEVKFFQEDKSQSLLIPFTEMEIDEIFEDIYPDSAILNTRYFALTAEHGNHLTQDLEKYAYFVTHLPEYESEVSLQGKKLKRIAIGSNVSDTTTVHDISSPTSEISTLPLLNDVIGKIHENKDRAELFCKFIIEYLLEHDTGLSNEIEVTCSCGEQIHRIIPSYWLARVLSDAWVPVITGEDGDEKVTRIQADRDAINQILSRDDFDDYLHEYQDKFIEFLRFFGFDELDLKVKLKSMESGVSERQVRNKTSKLVNLTDKIDEDMLEIVAEDPDAFQKVCDEYLRRKEFERDECLQEENTRDNKRAGEHLEYIIQQLLENSGLSTIPTYIGSDLEIWPDQQEGWDLGIVELRPYYIEIKLTSTNRVHLSTSQGKMAFEKGEYYSVLVVSDGAAIRERLLQDIEDPSHNKDLISTIVQNSFVIEGIFEKLGTPPDPYEVEPDLNGYWLKRGLWKSRGNIQDWIDRLKPCTDLG